MPLAILSQGLLKTPPPKGIKYTVLVCHTRSDSWWLNLTKPFEKYANVKMGDHLPRGSGWTYKIFELPPSSSIVSVDCWVFVGLNCFLTKHLKLKMRWMVQTGNYPLDWQYFGVHALVQCINPCIVEGYPNSVWLAIQNRALESHMRGIRKCKPNPTKEEISWRIIPFSKWLVTMVIVSPQFLGLWDPFQMA